MPLPYSYSELMILDLFDAVAAVADCLELPVTLCDALSPCFESPVSEELLREMRHAGRCSSESTIAYQWALEQSRSRSTSTPT
jgi:hypothetical protein